MATMTDYEKYEKTVIFGGITHKTFEPIVTKQRLGTNDTVRFKDNKYSEEQ